jgi:hypothetical protein
MWTNGKPKSDFAFTLFCCGTRYLPGTNAVINALDYHGSKIDLHLVHRGMPAWWIQKIQEADLNYRLELVDIEEMIQTVPQEFKDWKYWQAQDWPVVFGFVYYPFMLKDRYKVTGVIQADCLLLEDLTPWFKMVEGTGLLVTAWHSFHGTFLENFDPAVSPTVFPIWPSPWLWEPLKWADVVDYILKKIIFETPEFHEMRALGYAVHYLKKKDRVVLLNDIEWLEHAFLTSPVRDIKMSNGKTYLLNLPENLRLKMLHGCWYSKGFIKGVTEHPDAKDPLKSMLAENTRVAFGMYRLFNETWKVKLRANIEDVDYLVQGPPE